MRGRAATVIARLRTDLDRSLFPPSPPDAVGFRGWEGVAVLVSFLALAAALQLLRIGPTAGLSSLWAEDGPVFLGGAMKHGFLDALTATYAEYLVLAPRLIGELGALVPLRDAAVTMDLASALLVGLCGVAVWFASASHVRSTYLRALLVALTVLPPVSGIETVVTATNVLWYMAFATFWLLLWRPATTWGACLGGALILVAGLSTPAVFFFAPLAGLRAIAIRDRRDAIVVGCFAVAMAIQLPVTALSGEQVSHPAWTANILVTFLQRVVDGSVLGLELGGSAWASWGWPFLIAIGVAVAACLALLALRASAGRLLAAIAVATSVVMFLASGYVRGLGDAMVWPTGVHNGLGARYAIIPALLLVSAALVLADSRERSSGSRSPAAIALATVLLVPLVTSFDVGVGGGRGGPQWGTALRTATARCEAGRLAEAPVFVAPAGMAMTISCNRLESADGAAPAR